MEALSLIVSILLGATYSMANGVVFHPLSESADLTTPTLVLKSDAPSYEAGDPIRISVWIQTSQPAKRVEYAAAGSEYMLNGGLAKDSDGRMIPFRQRSVGRYVTGGWEPIPTELTKISELDLNRIYVETAERIGPEIIEKPGIYTVQRDISLHIRDAANPGEGYSMKIQAQPIQIEIRRPAPASIDRAMRALSKSSSVSKEELGSALRTLRTTRQAIPPDLADDMQKAFELGFLDEVVFLLRYSKPEVRENVALRLHEADVSSGPKPQIAFALGEASTDRTREALKKNIAIAADSYGQAVMIQALVRSGNADSLKFLKDLRDKSDFKVRKELLGKSIEQLESRLNGAP